MSDSDPKQFEFRPEDVVYLTADHPEANGREPQRGEESWIFWFPLPTGNRLVVRAGRKGMMALRHIVLDQLIDEKIDARMQSQVGTATKHD